MMTRFVLCAAVSALIAGCASDVTPLSNTPAGSVGVTSVSLSPETTGPDLWKLRPGDVLPFDLSPGSVNNYTYSDARDNAERKVSCTTGVEVVVCEDLKKNARKPMEYTISFDPGGVVTKVKAVNTASGKKRVITS